MGHLALYRKFRPANFDEVVGQEHLTTTLINQVKSGKISHAYLFTGTRGTGKTSTAKIFAKAINCLSPENGSPCNKCTNCVELSKPSSMDILEIDAASNNRVDEIRELREQAKFTPVIGKYKVYIIDEVHMLTDSAFNALLKTLEEPPAHVVFILATTEVHKLPGTILSRLMRFDLKLIDTETLEKLITKIFAESGIKASKEAIKLIAKAGEGSARDAISVADMCGASCEGEITYEHVLNCTGASSPQTMLELIGSIVNKDVKAFLNVSANIYLMGKNINVVLKDLNSYLRNLIIIKTSDNANNFLTLPQDIFEKLSEYAQQTEIKTITTMLEKLALMEQNLKYTTSGQTLFEACMINLMLDDETVLSSDKKKANKQPIAQKEDARKIWAVILKEVKQFSSPIMFAVLGEITEVSTEGNNFNIYASSEAKKFAEEQVNYAKLTEVFKQKGYDYNILIHEQKLLDDNQENINKLQAVFGNKLIIK